MTHRCMSCAQEHSESVACSSVRLESDDELLTVNDTILGPMVYKVSSLSVKVLARANNCIVRMLLNIYSLGLGAGPFLAVCML